MKFSELPSAEELRELFDYDVLRGELINRQTRGGHVKTGSIAGCVNKKGYRQVKLDGKIYKGHRLIWKWHYGIDPSGDLDHRDQEGITPKRNHVWGLRELTRREHGAITRAHCKESSLPIGVHRHGSRFQALIGQNGKNVHLGMYGMPGEAHQAYLEALQIIESGGNVVSAARPQSSQYKGVTWYEKEQKWVARPTVGGKRKYLGRFSTEIEAYQAVCKAFLVT